MGSPVPSSGPARRAWRSRSRNAHVKMDFFLGYLPRRLQARISRLSEALTLATLVLIVLSSAILIKELGHMRSPAAEVPLAIIFFPIGLGCAVWALTSVRRLLAPPKPLAQS